VDPSPLPVVCAIIENALGRVLVAQRPAHKHLGLKWEFPGGKVEAPETPEAALGRELKEELGCLIEIKQPLPHVVHDYGHVKIKMMPFFCRLSVPSAAPHPHEHVALRWLSREELRTIDWAPADIPVLASYLSLQREKRFGGDTGL